MLRDSIEKAKDCVYNPDESMHCVRNGYAPFDCPTCSQFKSRSQAQQPAAGPDSAPAFRRICVTRQGYAVVPGATNEEALENAKHLTQSDFDWEPVNSDMIEASAEVIEPCGPNGELIDTPKT